MGTTLRRKHKKSGDSGFESRAGFSTANPQTRWPNGKAPDYGTTFCKNYSFCSSQSTTSKNSLATIWTREGESGSCLSIFLIMFVSYAHMMFRTQDEDPTSSVFPRRKILKVSKALCWRSIFKCTITIIKREIALTLHNNTHSLFLHDLRTHRCAPTC